VKTFWYLVPVALLGVLAYGIWQWNVTHFGLGYWLQFHTGTINEPGPYYGFFSGFGSDLAEVTIIGGLIAIYKKHNCHQRWCWRLGHHALTDPITGMTYNLCRRHHPDHPGTRSITAAFVADVHARHLAHVEERLRHHSGEQASGGEN